MPLISICILIYSTTREIRKIYQKIPPQTNKQGFPKCGKKKKERKRQIIYEVCVCALYFLKYIFFFRIKKKLFRLIFMRFLNMNY